MRREDLKAHGMKAGLIADGAVGRITDAAERTKHVRVDLTEKCAGTGPLVAVLHHDQAG